MPTLPTYIYIHLIRILPKFSGCQLAPNIVRKIQKRKEDLEKKVPNTNKTM